MKLGVIALKIRAANTRFGDRVGGAAELLLARTEGTFQGDVAFVVPMAEEAVANDGAGHINQRIVERFGILVALKNDESQRDKLGYLAYDQIHDTRAELFRALLNWQMPVAGVESIVSYAGGQIEEITPAYLWYRFDFQVTSRIDDDDGVPEGPTDGLFERLYAEYVNAE